MLQLRGQLLQDEGTQEGEGDDRLVRRDSSSSQHNSTNRENQILSLTLGAPVSETKIWFLN